MGVTNCQGQVTGLEIWDDFDHAGGSLEAAFSFPGTIVELNEAQDLDHLHELDVRFAREDAAYSSLDTGDVLQLEFGSCIKEFKVEEIVQERDQAGDKYVRILATGPSYEIANASGVVYQQYANGRKDPHVELYGLTPTEHLSFILSNGDVPSMFSVGTVSFSTRVDMIYDFANPWQAILQLADTVARRVMSPVEVSVEREASDYSINLIAARGATADTVEVDYAENQIRLKERLSLEKWATRVVTKSGGSPGEQISIAQNLMEIASIGGSVLTMVDDLVGENDQYNGLYAQKPDNSLTQITDSAVDNSITVASAAGLSPGDKIRIVADSNGSDLLWMESPADKNNYGLRTLTLDRPEVPPIVNIAPNPYFLDWTAGDPDDWEDYNQPSSVTQETSQLYSKYGFSTMKLVLAEIGSGSQTSAQTIYFSEDLRHLTVQIALYVESGSIRLELIDETDASNPEIWFPETADERGNTTVTGEYIENLAVFPGEDFYDLHPSGGTFRTRIVAEEPNTTVYIDAHQFVRQPAAAEYFYDGSAGRDLLLIAVDYLKNFSAPFPIYDVEFVDEDRLGLVSGEEVEVGGDVELTDAGLGFSAVSKRIHTVEWNHLIPGETRVGLERIPAQLSERFLGRPPAPIRQKLPDNITKPECVQNILAWLVGDLEIAWDRSVGAARYEVRSVTPDVTKSDLEIWQAGDRLTVTDDRSWILKDGAKLDLAGGAVITAADVTHVMVEAYSSTGVPSRCYAINDVVPIDFGVCANLITDSTALDLYCNLVDATGPLLLRSPPLTVPYSAIQPLVTQGETTLTICHQGSSEGPGLTINGYMGVCWPVFGDSFSRQRLDRIDGNVLVNAWSHSFNVFGDGLSRKWMGTSVSDAGSGTHDVRLISHDDMDTPGTPTYQSSGICCQEVLGSTDPYVGEDFYVGVRGGAPEARGPSPARIFYSNGYISPTITVTGLSNQRLKLTRNSGDKWLGAQTHHPGTTFTGDGTISELGTNSMGGGRWNQLDVTAAGGTVEETIYGSDCPTGKIWPGSEFDLGSGFDSTSHPLGVNAAGTIGMTLDGYIYEQDWEALALAGGVIPSAYNYSANVALDGVNGWLAMSAEGAWIVHGAATYDTAVSNATVGMTSGSYGGGGALLAISPVVQSTLRLTWDDPLGLTIIGGGAGDGTDIDAFYTEKIWTGQWPVGADTLTIEQLQLGPGIGQSCSQNVQLVVGNQCCAVLIPGVPDLPPGTIDCLLTAQLKVWHLDDCAGGTGIGLAVAGSVQKTENCPDIGTTFGYALDVMYFEEYDPTNFPDSFAMVRYVKNAIVPVAWTADPTPYAFNHLVSTQDPLGTNPNVGTPRGSNGINPLARKWYARVIMRSLTNRNTVGSLDTAIITSPAYGWCP